MIDILESKNQNILIKEQAEKSEIILENVKEQSIRIFGKTEIEEIPIKYSSPLQRITVGIPDDTDSDISILLDTKVPKALNVLSPISSSQFGTMSDRQASRVYVDANGEARYATIESIKALNTKTIFVDTLNDSRIYSLSNDDIILLNEG